MVLQHRRQGLQPHFFRYDADRVAQFISNRDKDAVRAFVETKCARQDQLRLLRGARVGDRLRVMRKAEVIMPDGSHYTFVDNGAGPFTPPAGRYDTMVRNGDDTFDLTLQRSHSKLHFGSDGLLLSVTDDYGNSLSYNYELTTARLQRVADSSGSGRYLDITWAPNGRISAVQDDSGRVVQYSYNTNGTLPR